MTHHHPPPHYHEDPTTESSWTTLVAESRAADAPVPAYTETDSNNNDLLSLVTNLSSLQTSRLQLPITSYPPFDLSRGDDSVYLTSHLILALFEAIRSKNPEIVHRLITQGILSPDVPNGSGQTPLLAAVHAGDGHMVCTLVNLGADVNLFGRSLWMEGLKTNAPAQRTPLMLAAEQGKTALVKLLWDDLGADDALIAPDDGQIALRLAAENGHRDTVALLPARRGGEWARWKAHHEVMVRRIRWAGKGIAKFVKVLAWYLPRFIVWSVPKHVLVIPMRDGVKWGWRNKGKFGGWCKRQVKAMPERAKRAGKGVVKAIREMPGAVQSLLKGIWRFVKKIPVAVSMVIWWLWTSLKRVGKATGEVFLKMVSAVHTAVMAVLDFFRGITLKDVWSGVVVALRAVFVGLPKAVWEGVKGFGKVSKAVMMALLGGLGWMLWWLFRILLWVVAYVPMELWNIVCGIGSSLAKGYHEILVWFNPKHGA